ncbi:hypothetical protein GCM10022415_05780 [Knoellia locipacati]|uniref:Uncharacterized protein n=1 Tax=Knoellia locipacati TaxID=882824 RepID=A0A512SX83_9MICO|nr:hypothetical protein KLO01_05760 [Knoellia locipacati]
MTTVSLTEIHSSGARDPATDVACVRVVVVLRERARGLNLCLVQRAPDPCCANNKDNNAGAQKHVRRERRA